MKKFILIFCILIFDWFFIQGCFGMENVEKGEADKQLVKKKNSIKLVKEFLENLVGNQGFKIWSISTDVCGFSVRKKLDDESLIKLKNFLKGIASADRTPEGYSFVVEENR